MSGVLPDLPNDKVGMCGLMGSLDRNGLCCGRDKATGKGKHRCRELGFCHASHQVNTSPSTLSHSDFVESAL